MEMAASSGHFFAMLTGGTLMVIYAMHPGHWQRPQADVLSMDETLPQAKDASHQSLTGCRSIHCEKDIVETVF
jgi:hypothetical protein